MTLNYYNDANDNDDIDANDDDKNDRWWSACTV